MKLVFHPDVNQHLLGLFTDIRLGFRWCDRIQPEHAITPREAGDHDIFQNTEIGKDFRRLKNARHAGLVDLPGFNPSRDWPSKVTVPESGISLPMKQFRSVDLPAPLGPMMAWIVPSSTLRFTSSSACRPPKRLLTPLISRKLIRLSPYSAGADTVVLDLSLRASTRRMIRFAPQSGHLAGRSPPA